jgi:hypothetical protein
MSDVLSAEGGAELLDAIPHRCTRGENGVPKKFANETGIRASAVNQGERLPSQKS